jgi:hypothetical protein
MENLRYRIRGCLQKASSYSSRGGEVYMGEEKTIIKDVCGSLNLSIQMLKDVLCEQLLKGKFINI